MFKNFRLKIGHSQLRKQLKALKRDKRVHNFESARKIGILLLLNSDNDFEQALGMMAYLTEKNLETTLLGLYLGKEIPHKYLMRKNIHIFNKKDVNWYGKPLLPYTNEFMGKEFDILIDLTMAETFPLKWIASLSRAKFKVGCLSYYGNPNDLIINITSNNTIEFLIEQIKHYLYLINNRFAQEAESKKRKATIG